MRREFLSEDPRHQKKITGEICNAYIRERDIQLPCISCGTYTGQRHAGHYKSVGHSSSCLRYNEENIHGQCAQCNGSKSGDITNYRVNLVKKIGVDRVEWLEGYHPPFKHTIEDLKGIQWWYKEKTKWLLDARVMQM